MKVLVIGDAVPEALAALDVEAVLDEAPASQSGDEIGALAADLVVAAVSAPTSLAVELAEQVGMTLVGFLRGDTMNVYTHPNRVTLPASAPA